VDITSTSLRAFHLAGIIPVASSRGQFNLPGHDVLMPIGIDFTLIERSVLECSYAGCESIWIVCNDDIAPILKERVGDYVADMMSAGKSGFAWYGSETITSIPIYYVPIHPKHRDKIDCYAWSILHGANVAYWLCRRLSRWMVPDRYYVSFPFGVYNPSAAHAVRTQIKSAEPFCFSFENLTVCDGLPLGFTLNAAEWKSARDVVKKNSKEYYPPLEGEKYPSRKLPKEKRFESRSYTLAEVFKDVFKTLPKVEVSWFYDLTRWEEYCKLIEAGHVAELARPAKFSTGHINLGENDSE